MWGETTARQLAKGEWKFRMASKIHFILAGLASNSRKASRNLKMLATITGYCFKLIYYLKKKNHYFIVGPVKSSLVL
jgi:hypothetical protein